MFSKILDKILELKGLKLILNGINFYMVPISNETNLLNNLRKNMVETR